MDRARPRESQRLVRRRRARPRRGPLRRARTVLRLGRSLFVFRPDVRRFMGSKVERHGAAVVGPTLRAAWDEIERAARFSEVLHVCGESGAGKELAARVFHTAGPAATGPFIAVNCAAIPQGLAERLFFGARRGTFSGANADADGYLQAAHGGTLFLDEVAELDKEVQAKLLRALEAKEVLPLGASTPRTVDLRVCSATRDLRAEVAAGRFREDLYFRIGRPDVTIPPLRARLEDIAWLIDAELSRAAAGSALVASARFVEACLVRRWPGNVRELTSEVRRAAGVALTAGRAVIEHEELGANAGMDFARRGEPPAHAERAGLTNADVVLATLREHAGNVTRAAQALGVHRNQLRRWLAAREK